MKLSRSSGLIAALAAFIAGPSAHASDPHPGYIVGKIIDITSTQAGLMIRMDDNRVPTNCGDSAYGWILVPQANSTMISVFLTYWAGGKKNFTIYADPVANSYCTVNQIDPIDY